MKFHLPKAQINVMKRFAEVHFGVANIDILKRNNKATITQLVIKGYVDVNETRDGVELSEKGKKWVFENYKH